MQEEKDSLGRRKRRYDVSAAIKKGNQTKKEKHGEDYQARIGSVGGSRKKRGYFGRLKDLGRTEELRKISLKGNQKSNSIQSAKRNKTDQEPGSV